MTGPVNKVKAAFQHTQTENVPKGELWLGTDLLKEAGFEDDLSGHIKLIEYLKQDMICLPIAHEPSMNKNLGYRYFSVSDADEALKTADLFVVTIIDGPFQRLVEKKGLVEVLSLWMKKRNDFSSLYEKERAIAEELLYRCLDASVHGVIIADDMAGDSSTFMNPRHIDTFFTPFYSQATQKIHDAAAVALFHSCGAISAIVPTLLSNGFDGLAAVQHRINDLISLKLQYKSRLILVGGIDGEMLQKEELSSDDMEEFKNLVKNISRNGDFVLSSACGLYSGQFLKRIQYIYNYMAILENQLLT
jgi:hypothetical protein